MRVQGICLGQQDSLTPLKVFASVAMLNLVGDVYLILGRGLGVFGAAAATTAAQYVGALYFFNYLRNKVRGLPLRARLPHQLPGLMQQVTEFA